MFNTSSGIFAVISEPAGILDVLYYLKDKKEVFSLFLHNGNTIAGFICVSIGAYPSWHDAYGTYFINLSNGISINLDAVKNIQVYKSVLKDYVPSTGVKKC